MAAQTGNRQIIPPTTQCARAVQQTRAVNGSSRSCRSLRLRWRAMTALLLAIATAGYWLASQNLPTDNAALADGLRSLFIAGVLVTVALGLMLPGRVARSADEVSDASLRLANGTLTQLRNALRALAAGKLDAATAALDVSVLKDSGDDELGRMAASFNLLQSEIARVVVGLDGARESLHQRRADADQLRTTLRQQVRELTPEIQAAQRELAGPRTRPASPVLTASGAHVLN